MKISKTNVTDITQPTVDKDGKTVLGTAYVRVRICDPDDKSPTATRIDLATLVAYQTAPAVEELQAAVLEIVQAELGPRIRALRSVVADIRR